MFAAAFLVFLFVTGLGLAGLLPAPFGFNVSPQDWIARTLGWAMILLAVFKWRLIWRGGRRIGAVVIYGAAVVLAVWLFNGVRLWERF